MVQTRSSNIVFINLIWKALLYSKGSVVLLPKTLAACIFKYRLCVKYDVDSCPNR